MGAVCHMLRGSGQGAWGPGGQDRLPRDGVGAKSLAGRAEGWVRGQSRKNIPRGNSVCQGWETGEGKAGWGNREKL